MFIKFPVSTTTPDYDYVVVGAGVAGLLLAERLSAIGKILIIEIGNLDKPCESGSGFYDIESVGHPFTQASSRVAAFGGSSNHWEGSSRPFSPTVFANRTGMPGWPIHYAEFAQYLPEAEKFLNLIPHQPDDEERLPHPLLEDHQDIRVMHFQHSDPLRRLGDQETTDQFSRAEHIDIVLDTRVVDINLNVDGSFVESIELLHRPSGKTQLLGAKNLIMCTGGIENARLMLLAGRKYPTGNPLLGGRNELTGKWFTEHPRIQPVEMFFDERIDLSGTAHPRAPGWPERWYFCLSDRCLRNNSLPRFGLGFHDAGGWADKSVMTDADNYYYKQSDSYWMTTPSFTFEQTPLADSQVTLSDSTDDNGIPLARINWQIAADDIDQMRRAVLLFCGLMAQHGVTRSKLIPDAQCEDWSGLKFMTGCHHMGTTRMALEPSAGVVDTNLKVFGLHNMYVAGSSVFPSCDWVNPTLNLTALAARLGDHLVRASTKNTQTMLLGEGSKSVNILGDGWSNPEVEGTWSDGNRAELNIKTKGAQQLILHGRPYTKTQVRMIINGKQFYSGHCGGLFNTTFNLDGQSMVNIVFHLSNIISPQSIGENTDIRMLGIFLSGLQVR